MRTSFLLTLGVSMLLAAAAQAGQEKLAAGIRDARIEATRAAEHLQSTLGALNALTGQKEGDLRPAYDTFTARVQDAEAAAKWTASRVQWMTGDAQHYFESWENTVAEIANKSLRSKAQKRLDAVRKRSEKVAAALKSAGEKFKPFLSDLSDLNKMLSKDLTAGGVKATRGTVKNANWHYQSVKAAIARALKEMQAMEESLSSEVK